MKRLALLLRKLLGGRPMELRIPHYFTNCVAREPVHIWQDAFERLWMSTTKWGWFRVRSGLFLLFLGLVCAHPLAAQDTPSYAIEAGVMAPRDPTAQFGLILGNGATRFYSRFSYDAEGKARGVETGIERLVYHSKRFDIISRAVAGVAQDENNTSGSVAGSFGFVIPLRWGLSIVALGEGSNAPVRDGEWKGGAALMVRWAGP